MMKDKKISLFEQIQNDIKRQIFTGQLSVGDKLPSELKLCEMYDVSRITAKRAIDNLSAEGYVKRVKGSGSYVTSPQENTRLLGSERVFSFIIPFDTATGRGVDMVSGANAFLQQNNCILNILNTQQDVEVERRILQEVMSGYSRGAIYYPISRFTNWDLLVAANALRFPMVTVDKYVEHDLLGSVLSDNYNGAYQAVDYLIRHGHQHIGFLSEVSDSIEERFYGYCAAIRDHSLPFDTQNYYLGFWNDAKRGNPYVYDILLHRDKPFDRECVAFLRPILSRLLESPHPVTAIFAINDYVAMYTLKTALAMGIRVPEELSIIGFDNLEFSRHLEVPLTTVEQNFYQIGWNAAQKLFDHMMGTVHEPQKVIVPVTLIERSSVAPPARKPRP